MSLVLEPPVASTSTAPAQVCTQQIYLGECDVLVSKAPPQGVVASTKPHKIIYRPLNPSSTQFFTGQPKLSNVFHKAMHARELTKAIGVPKNALNLKQLEMLKKHCEFVEKQPSYAAAVASPSKIEEVQKDCSHPAPLECTKIDHAAVYEKHREKC